MFWNNFRRSNFKVSKTAVVVAVHHGKSRQNTTRSHHASDKSHGNVNIWLGAAMLSSVIVVLILLCYCCHKNSQKHRPQEYVNNSLPTNEINNLGVFMIPSAGVRCGLAAVDSVETRSRPSTRGPPPAYESLNLNPSFLTVQNEKLESSPRCSPKAKKMVCQASAKSERAKDGVSDEELPTYEVALKLESDKPT